MKKVKIRLVYTVHSLAQASAFANVSSNVGITTQPADVGINSATHEFGASRTEFAPKMFVRTLKTTWTLAAALYTGI